MLDRKIISYALVLQWIKICSTLLDQVHSVEEQVRAVAEHKLGVANQSITAGFFDNKTRFFLIYITYFRNQLVWYL